MTNKKLAKKAFSRLKMMGIILPFIILILLALISNMGGAIKTEFNYESEVEYNNREPIYLGELILENDYFLPRKYILPEIGYCFLKEGVAEGYYYQLIQFSEGEYNRNVFGPDEFFTDRGSYRSIELKAGETKNVSLLGYVNRFPDTIVIFEKPEGKYFACNSLTMDQIENSIQIKLKTNITCTDSDNGFNEYVAGTASGIDINSVYTTSSDYCSGQNLIEYYCSGNILNSQVQTCNNGCSAGRCW